MISLSGISFALWTKHGPVFEDFEGGRFLDF
jgi:hypothetical protein